MKIYHPSNRKFDVVKIKYFGASSYTRTSLNTSIVKRSFWYLTPRIPERIFDYSPYIYVADIKENELYDLRIDKQGLEARFNNADKFLRYIRKEYKGVIYNVGCNIIAMFVDVKPIKIIER